jgi:hypothetical protein
MISRNELQLMLVEKILGMHREALLEYADVFLHIFLDEYNEFEFEDTEESVHFRLEDTENTKRMLEYFVEYLSQRVSVGS